MDRRRFYSDDEVAPRAWAGLAVVAAALFVATLDAMVLYVAAARLLGATLGATTIVVPGAAHLIPNTHPEAVVDAVRRDVVARRRSERARA